MFATVVSVSSLLLGIAILLVGSGLLGTLVALRGGLEGFGAPVIGAVMSAYFVGFVAGTFLCPRIIHRVGHIRSYAMFAAIASSAAILHVLVIHPWVWGGLRVITGACLVGLYMVIESWLNTRTPAERRGRVFAIYMAVTLLALALGQALVASAPASGFTLFGVVSILISLALVPIALTSVTQPDPVSMRRLGARRLYRAAPLAVVGTLASGLVLGTFWGMGPLFAQRIGLDGAGIAAMMSATVLGGAALQFPIGRLSDRYDRRRVLALGAASAGLCALVALVATWFPPAMLVGAMFLFGGSTFSLYAVAVAHCHDHLGADEILGGSSALLLVHGAASALGPILSGALMGRFGPRVLPLWFAVVLLALALYAAHRVRRVPPLPVAEYAEIAVPRIAATGAALQTVAPAEPEPGAASGSAADTAAGARRALPETRAP
jgi:MFS family permease